MGANDRELNDPFLPPENEYHEWLLALEHELTTLDREQVNRDSAGLSSRTLLPEEIEKIKETISRRTDIDERAHSQQQNRGVQDAPKKEQEQNR